MKSGEEILCAMLYLDNSDKSRFADLKNHVENDYVLHKAEYTRTGITVHSRLLKYQPSYNSNINYESNGVRNHLLFVQRRKTGDGF